MRLYRTAKADSPPPPPPPTPPSHQRRPVVDTPQSRKIPSVPSPRARKGVHSRYRRSQGSTPQEAEKFNSILADMWADLSEQSGPLRPGSSPLRDPYGKTVAAGGTFWGPRMREKRSSRFFDQGGRDEEDAVDEELDTLKEEMSVIDTDAELVNWAERRVFTPISSDDNGIKFLRAYPRILAHLLKVVRTNFSNPHLALALFHHAQTHSIESYITGCLSSAYNEVLRTRWESFRDLEGVEQGVREMEVNGVNWDGGTHKLVGKVIEDAGLEMIHGNGHVRYGDEAFDRLKRLDLRLQKDVRLQDALYAKKRADGARIRYGMPQENETSFA